MSARIARYIGVRRGSAEAGYKVFLDLLGHVAARLGLGAEDAGRILRRLGIEIPGALLKTITGDLRDRLGILGEEEISQYLEILPIIAEGSGEKDPAALGSSLSFASKISSSLVRDLVGGEGIALGDLFIGGGPLLRSVVLSLGPQRISRVWGFGVNPLASLAGYASLLDLLDPRRISISYGDPFEKIYRALASKSLGKKYRSDLVLLHPLLLLEDRIPRKRIPEIYRVLVGLGYGEHVIKRRLRLSAASMLLAHSVLREGGALIAIVPAHILYKVSSGGVRRILRDRYSIAAIVETPYTSLSGRGFTKDILIAAWKSRLPGWETSMVRIEGEAGDRPIDILGGAEEEGVYIYKVDLRSLWGSVQNTWIHFFSLGGYDKRFAEILEDLMDSGRLIDLGSIAEGIYIRRGISIRSPRFFVIPNRYWGVRHRGRSYTVIYSKEDLRELEIDNSYLLPIIRRSKKRRDPYQSLVSRPSHYIFTIPPKSLYSIDREVVRYIEWGMRSGAAESAVRLFGAEWYSYPYKEIYSRRLIADLFVSSALWSGARLLCTNSLLSSEPAVAGNGFYAVAVLDRGLRSFLTIWFNSTFFIYLFARIGRILDYRWNMISSDDFLSLPAPRILDSYVYKEAEEIIDKYGSQRLPPLHIQLRSGHRVRDEIDSLVSRLLGLREEDIAEMRIGLLEILP